MNIAISQALEKAFINRDIIGNQYNPQLIINQPQKNQYFINLLQDDLEQSEEFFFSIAFITKSGLNAIKTQLADLNDRRISGRLITSTYQYFNHPDVFKELLKIPNLEVRISQKDGFHSKGYLFKHKDSYSFVIGSSNLTMSALKTNYEWNIRLTSLDHGEIIHQVKNHLEEEWIEAQILDQHWIRRYRRIHQDKKPLFNDQIIEDTALPRDIIRPNKMQQAALSGIKSLRDEGARRALVISATGTGKTYLSAFDVLQAQPERMVFIVHREQILKDAMSSYQKIIGGPASDYGILSGNSKNTDVKYLFATVQTLSQSNVLNSFEANHFSYILIDEAHRSGADSYQRIIDYFEPDFLMGMSATPERTDNINIFELYNYNVAYEIRLQDALKENFLTPFHYFGVTDYVKDGEIIEETTNLQHLVGEERVNYLIEKINYYGHSGDRACGLVFCSQVKEAHIMSRAFNEKGFNTIALSGDDNQDTRQLAVKELESGKLDYIFTVDIFNEGIDIPRVNQVIMMRNTQSSIVFTQQLGRGLRKHNSKEFVTIIDFIGNYKNNYLIPIALSGDAASDKNALREKTFNSHFISGLSAINFEHVAKEQIYQSIESVNLNAMPSIDKAYQQLKYRLGYIPKLTDFYHTDILKPEIIANKKDTYYGYLLRKEQDIPLISESGQNILKFLTREIMPGFRRHEIILLQEISSDPFQQFTLEDLKVLFEKHKLLASYEIIHSVIKTLDTSFYTGSSAKIYNEGAAVVYENEQLKAGPILLENIKNDYFKEHLNDILKLGELNASEFDSQQTFTRHKKYRRRDTLRLLNWEEQMVDQNIGGYAYRNRDFIIFITLDKGDDFTGALIAYEDRLLSPDLMHWFTKSPRRLSSPEVQIILNETSDWNFYVFAKKSNDEENKDFYYLGEVIPDTKTVNETSRITSADKKQSVVQMDLKFKDSVEYRLYRYLTSYEEEK